MTDVYAYWKAALAGEKPKIYNEQPECGFYRSGIYEKQENKARKRVGWNPVAIFLNDGELTAVVGDQAFADRDKLNGLWSYCAGNPISEEWYRAVTRGEPWPDSHETVAALPVANSSVVMHPVPIGAKVTSPHNVISEQIDECTHQIIKYAKIESDEQSAKARSLQNRFLDLRGDVKREYDKLNDPLLAEQKRIREIWFPLRDLADAGSLAMRTAMGTWEDIKRKAAKVAAERAEAGQVDAKSNVPPPATQIRGGAGKAASVSVAVFVTAVDEDAVFKQFKGNPAMTELLISLAQKAIRAGIAVPGATTEERSVVR